MINVRFQARKNSNGGHKRNKRSSAAVIILHLWMLSERRGSKVFCAVLAGTGV